ncbi:hypothetical protein CAI16_05560 [Virgibacillus dokdonensis]|uniref:ABC transporter domain-containing protein n=2 Tax=Virgibacillus dokdonensis TaxID=302167 RepID=A0A3E0WW78_9BACI|nr:hypothetical protein CAI16_05560 [Virgibacillus dokdonensis]
MQGERNMFLEAKSISKSFGDKRALQDVTMNIKENEVLGVIGHNGAGKTTLFKLLLSMYQPNEGEIVVHESPFHLKNDVGYLPEERGLYGKTDVYSQLLAFGYLKGKKKQVLVPQIHFWLDYFELQHDKRQLVANLSKGNQQKVQFITAVLHQPKLLILDEPFSGLDPLHVERFTNAMTYMKQQGSTILYSSHLIKGMEQLTDRILLLKQGEVVFQECIEAIRGRYGYLCTIKNPCLQKDMLIELGYPFSADNGTYVIELKQKSDVNAIVNQIPLEQNEWFTIEPMSLEAIFKRVNREVQKVEQ